MFVEPPQGCENLLEACGYCCWRRARRLTRGETCSGSRVGPRPRVCIRNTREMKEANGSPLASDAGRGRGRRYLAPYVCTSKLQCTRLMYLQGEVQRWTARLRGEVRKACA